MGILYTGIYAKCSCTSSYFSSIQGEVKPIGRKAWVSCLLSSSRCTSAGLVFKGLETALNLGFVECNEYAIGRYK